VRELENLVRRLVVLHDDTIISADAVEAELTADVPETSVPADSLSVSVENHIRRYFDALKGDMPPPGLYGRVLREVEEPLIVATLAITRGNQLRAADILGLNRNTLRKKIKALNIKAGR
jgi:two-component system nitrogen regulation response regulator GlnG